MHSAGGPTDHGDKRVASQDGISQDQSVYPGKDDRLQTHSIGDTLQRMAECSRLASLVNQAGAQYLLNRSGMHTLLAPVDTAIQQLRADQVEAFLTEHLLPGGSELSDLRLVNEVRTQGGTVLTVEPESTGLRVGGAKILRADIPCTNGFIHTVDGNLRGREADRTEAQATRS